MTQPPNPGAIMTFDSHIEGKNAQVTLYPTHIEWTRAGKVGMGRVALGAATAGVALRGSGVRKQGTSETIPVRAITGVSTRKSGLNKTEVVVTAAGSAIGFRCTPDEARQFQAALLQLMA